MDGLLTLSDLFERGVAVKVLDGIAAGEHTERSLFLDLALALAEDRRRDISRKTRNGLEAAAKRGTRGGRPTVITEDRRRTILARRAEDQSIRQIARGVGVSGAVVHGVIRDAEASSDPAENVVLAEVDAGHTASQPSPSTSGEDGEQAKAAPEHPEVRAGSRAIDPDTVTTERNPPSSPRWSWLRHTSWCATENG